MQIIHILSYRMFITISFFSLLSFTEEIIQSSYPGGFKVNAVLKVPLTENPDSFHY